MNELWDEKEVYNACRNIADFEDSSLLTINKISKGKMNHIYMIRNNISGREIVFKQSGESLTGLSLPTHVRFQLPLIRNTNEVEALKYISSFAPNLVPTVLQYSESNHYFIMDCMKDYIDLRDLFLKGVVTQGVGYCIADALETIKDNSLLYCNEHNSICMKDILYPLLFVVPFRQDFIKSNKFIPSNDQLYYCSKVEDDDLVKRIKELSYILFNLKETLTHGDLHAGSICVKNNELKLYDFEFAFAGPFGFDSGKLLGHFLLAAGYLKENGYEEEYQALCIEINHYLQHLSSSHSMIDIYRFCGLELISRITGLLQLKYTTEIKNPVRRRMLQKAIFDFGVFLLKLDDSMKLDGEFVEEFTRRLAF